MYLLAAPKPKPTARKSTSQARRISVKELGRRARRKDGKSSPSLEYKYRRWTERSSKKEVHKSHYIKPRSCILPEVQQFPGFCVLCPKQFYANELFRLEKHYTSVHLKRAVDFKKIILAVCKCSDVPNRGSDASTRNAHYHCAFCHKPCDGTKPLAKHMLCKHRVNPESVEHIS